MVFMKLFTVQMRVHNTVSRDGIRYIDEDVFLKLLPEAIAEEGSSHQLNME